MARTDIDDCFASIPRWPVIVRLRAIVTDLELVALVQRLISRPVIGEKSSRGLHQGASLSPMLANLYLDALIAP